MQEAVKNGCGDGRVVVEYAYLTFSFAPGEYAPRWTGGRRAICAVIPPNDSWPKLRWKILFTPQKETGVSRQKKETERFRNIDPTKNGRLGMRKPEKS